MAGASPLMVAATENVAIVVRGANEAAALQPPIVTFPSFEYDRLGHENWSEAIGL